MQFYRKRKILHITTHVGGGIGTVLLNYLKKTPQSSAFSHEIIALGYTESHARFVLREIESPYSDEMACNHNEIMGAIRNSDIVLIHWWNHPLIYDFLVRNQLPRSRVIIWSHVSGLHPPHIFTKKLIDYPDKFVFTTPISFGSEIIDKLPDRQKESISVIWATGVTDLTKSIQPRKHNGFNIGYIGTVDYAKISRNFLQVCSKINIPEAKFIVCGGSDELAIRQEARKMNIEKRFEFTGRVSNIAEYLSIFDLFGYPLASHHYGTCDQALVESMAAGVVPVVLSNPMENSMVKDGTVGIVAKDEEDYVRKVEVLYKNNDLRHSLSKNAREYASKSFSLDKMVEDWDRTFNKMMLAPKTSKKWGGTQKNNLSAKDIFLESLGDHGKSFVQYCDPKSNRVKAQAAKQIEEMGKLPAWQSESKGTVHNYSSYFPKDKNLHEWSSMMKKSQKENGG